MTYNMLSGTLNRNIIPTNCLQGPRQTERSEETITVSDRISQLRRVRLVINRDVMHHDNAAPSVPVAPVVPPPLPPHPPNSLRQPELPWYYSVLDASANVTSVSGTGRL